MPFEYFQTFDLHIPEFFLPFLSIIVGPAAITKILHLITLEATYYSYPDLLIWKDS